MSKSKSNNKSRRSKVQKYHDRVAGRYDASYEDEYWQWHDALTWDYLKPYLPRDLALEVVDLGCGTGKWAAKLAKSGFRVTCVDISREMLDQAERKIAAPGGTNRTEFVRADLCDLSILESGRFGLAVAFGEPIGCASSPTRALREIRRVLSDDGVLVATFDNRLAGIDFYLEAGTSDDLDRFLRDGMTHWLTKDRDEQFPIATYGPTELHKLLDSNGFEVIEMLGKTILPMRHHRELLADAEQRRQWARIEKRLARDPAAMGRAGHLQVVCRARSLG